MLKNLAISLLIVLLASVAFGQQRPSSSSASTNRTAAQTDATTVFRSARDLITDGEWAKAQEKFSEYVNSYPNEKNIDAALYWLAYTQQKLGKYDQCRATIERLLEKFPGTSWRDDARVLLAQTPGSYAIASSELASTIIGTTGAITLPPSQDAYVYTPSAPLAAGAVTALPGQAVAAAPYVWSVDGSSNTADDDDPCEFKIVVLQALFQTDPQRGIVAATDWLKPGSTQTVRCKSAALTLLGRNGGKAVTPVILGVARNESDLKLRARAISTLGATNDDSVIDALREFALNSPQPEIVEASLYALSKHTGERAIGVLSDIAISGKMTAQRKLAIASIASRPGEPAVDALFRIYDADQSFEIRRAVISGFANRRSERAGNKLFEIARSSDSVDLRKAAISAISRRGGDKAIDFLISLYDTEKNEELKDQIVNSLGTGSAFYVGSPIAIGSGQTTITSVGSGSRLSDQRVVRKLIEIAKNQQAPMERRRRAIGWLSRSKDPAVIQFLEELLR
jgi:HEAT repeat protein